MIVRNINAINTISNYKIGIRKIFKKYKSNSTKIQKRIKLIRSI